MRPLATRLLSVAAACLCPLPCQDLGLSFTNGVNSYLETPYSPILVPVSGITVEAWITYDDAIATGLNRFPTIIRQNFGGSESFFLRANAGTTAAKVLRFRVSTSTTNLLVDWPFTPGQLKNTWTHVAATYDGSIAALYVNGNVVATTPGNGLPMLDRGGALRIGKGADSTGPYEVWNGELDEVRLWPYARTQSEIQATMMQKLGSVPGRVVTWNFDNSFTDSSSNLTLTATGTVPVVTNSLTLTSKAMPTAVGASTQGCLGSILLGPTCVASVSNGAFAIAGTRVPAAAPGAWLVAPNVLGSPVRVLGVDVWANPAFGITVPANADGLGTVRLGLPIPASVFPGQSLATQVFVLDACGAQGLTASDALLVQIQA